MSPPDPSARQQGLRAALPLGVCAFLAAVLQAGLLVAVAPDAGRVREVAIARALDEAQFTLPALAPQDSRGAAAYCERWTGHELQDVDCLTGRRLSDLQAVVGPGAAQADAQALEHLQGIQARYESLAAALEAARQENPALQQSLMALRSKITAIAAARAQFEVLSPSQAAAAPLPWFAALVAAHGVRYDAASNRLRPVGWDIARLMDDPAAIAERGRALEQLLRLGAPVWALAALALMGLCAWRAGALGLAAAAGVTSLLALGLALVLSASATFGLGHLAFPLNPFGNQATRQAVLVGAGMGVVALSAAWRGLGLWPARRVLAQPAAVALLLIPVVVAAYALAGPAVGSEAYKFSMATLAAGLTVGLSRVTHAANNLAPGSIALGSWLFARDAAGVAIRRRLGAPLGAFVCWFILTTAIVGVGFRDFGAVLMVTLIGVAAVLVVLGLGPASVLMLVLGLGAAATLATDKLQARLALMADPWTAPISDFARLDAFAQSAGPWGHGIAQLPWCSGTGVCLPLQTLSDYMPTLLAGALGAKVAVGIFIVLCAGSALLAAWIARRYLTLRDGAAQVMAMTGFFLLMATLLQTVLTFLGNWRWIPLTGIGTPLVSIGFSSIAAPLMGLAAVLQVQGLEARATSGRRDGSL